MLDAMLGVFKDFGEKPSRMFVTTDGVKQTAYNEARLVKAFQAEGTTRVAVAGDGLPKVSVSFHLRNDPERKIRHQELRIVELITP
ncbi:MAG: hypothetical protein R3F43_00030 [bacterium]